MIWLTEDVAALFSSCLNKAEHSYIMATNEVESSETHSRSSVCVEHGLGEQSKASAVISCSITFTDAIERRHLFEQVSFLSVNQFDEPYSSSSNRVYVVQYLQIIKHVYI